MSRSDGSTADYYELPDGCAELQELISHRDMNAQIGEIFRACYRYGIVSHSDKLRDAKKMRFYADAEVKRLEKLAHKEEPAAAIDDESPRITAIGQNGNTGEHYQEDSTWLVNPGTIPVDNLDCVDVRFADGSYGSDRAYHFYWEPLSGSCCITHYRLSKDA